MRDPIFYRWHAFIDFLFQSHKLSLPAYTEEDLTFAGITVSSIQLESEGEKPNVFSTHWQQSNVNLSKGLDFMRGGDVFVKFTHLQHVPFTITIEAKNDSEAQRMGMIRVFLGPKFDEREQTWSFREQRLMMIEIDKFMAECEWRVWRSKKFTFCSFSQ